MADSARPQITDDHKKKYEEIMGLQVKSASQTPAPPSSSSGTKVNSILSSIPKPKGLGNKMFIFTGKKKIVMEGTQRQVEDVKTVTPAPEKEPPKEAEKKEVVKADTVKQAENPQQKKSRKKIPVLFLIFAVLVFIGAYTFLLLVLFGFINF